MKLAQYLARAGLGSRRKMEELVKSGRVAIDGEVSLDQSREVGESLVTVDGETVTPAEKRYFAWHKPAGITTTFADVHAEKTLRQALPPELQQYPLFAVGRLDRDTEGLLLLTTDGAWAERVIHPRAELAKVYEAEILQEIAPSDLATLRSGMQLDDGPVTPIGVEIASRQGDNRWLRITLREGRNRVVRRMLAKAHLPLGRLIRVAVGPYRLENLAPGKYREIDPEAIA